MEEEEMAKLPSAEVKEAARHFPGTLKQSKWIQPEILAFKEAQKLSLEEKTDLNLKQQWRLARLERDITKMKASQYEIKVLLRDIREAMDVSITPKLFINLLLSVIFILCTFFTDSSRWLWPPLSGV